MKRDWKVKRSPSPLSVEKVQVMEFNPSISVAVQVEGSGDSCPHKERMHFQPMDDKICCLARLKVRCAVNFFSCFW